MKLLLPCYYITWCNVVCFFVLEHCQIRLVCCGLLEVLASRFFVHWSLQSHAFHSDNNAHFFYLEKFSDSFSADCWHVGHPNLSWLLKKLYICKSGRSKVWGRCRNWLFYCGINGNNFPLWGDWRFKNIFNVIINTIYTWLNIHICVINIH